MSSSQHKISKERFEQLGLDSLCSDAETVTLVAAIEPKQLQTFDFVGFAHVRESQGRKTRRKSTTVKEIAEWQSVVGALVESFVAKLHEVQAAQVICPPKKIGLAAVPVDTKKLFYELLEQWRQDTEFSSNMTRALTHPAYYRIIALGKDVLPCILDDLAAGGGPWFTALDAITRENPVDPTHKNDSRMMREDWLAWGRKHEHIGD